MNAWKQLCMVMVATIGVGGVGGCGGGGAKPATTTPAKPAEASTGSEHGVATAMTEAQLKLGHFSTADGMHGFVLDRTGAKARLQVDGDHDIIELTTEEDRDHGDLNGYRLVDPHDKKRIYISKGGSIRYFLNGDEFGALYDKEAQPLGTPTVAGAPVKEKARWEIRGAALTPIAVRTKFPQFTGVDSANLAKVAEAFDQADPAMFVHYKAPGKDAWKPHLVVTPENISGMAYGRNNYVTDEDEGKRHVKLAKHGGSIAGFSSGDSAQGNHIIVSRADNSHDELADGTPGLIWEIHSTTAVFVSLDGGRYHVDINQESDPFEKGAGPAANWPKPAADTYVDLTMISALSKAGAGGDAVVAELDKIDGEWNACVVKGWKGAQEKIDTGKLSVGQEKAEIKKLHKACNKHLDAFEAVIVKYAEERAKAREALFAKASAKAKAAS